MRSLLFFACTLVIFASCKKEVEEAEHEVQFQSNVALTASSFTLTVDGTVETDLNKIHKLQKEASIQWQLDRDTSTTWLSATIYVDGRAVRSDAGYKDIDLSWTVK